MTPRREIMREKVERMCHQRKMMQRLVVSQVKSICGWGLVIEGSGEWSGLKTNVHVASISSHTHTHIMHAVIHMWMIHFEYRCYVAIEMIVIGKVDGKPGLNESPWGWNEGKMISWDEYSHKSTTYITFRSCNPLIPKELTWQLIAPITECCETMVPYFTFSNALKQS